MTSDYATLEEAFGVASFLAAAPEPPILRGDVGKVKDVRHKTFQSAMREVKAFDGAKMGPTRLPLQKSRCGAGVACKCTSKGAQVMDVADAIARAHAMGGAQAAWQLVPNSSRADMMWYAIRQAFDADVALVVIAALLLYVLTK